MRVYQLSISYILLSLSVSVVKAQDIRSVNASNVLGIVKAMQHEQQSMKGLWQGSTSVTLQVGNKNSLVADLLDDRITTLQLGNQNSIYYLDKGKNTKASETQGMTIQLRGQANRVEVNGSNSISNSMSIGVSGDRTIIQVKNYK